MARSEFYGILLQFLLLIWLSFQSAAQGVSDCDTFLGSISDPDADCAPCTNGMEKLVAPIRLMEDYHDDMQRIRDHLRQYLDDKISGINRLAGQNDNISLDRWGFGDITTGPDVSGDLEYIESIIEEMQAYRNRFEDYPAQSAWMDEWIGAMEELKEMLESSAELNARAQNLVEQLEHGNFIDIQNLNFDCCPEGVEQGYSGDQLDDLDNFTDALSALIAAHLDYRTHMAELCAHFTELLQNTLRVRAADESELTENRDQYADGLFSFLLGQLSSQVQTGISNLIEAQGDDIDLQDRRVIEAFSEELGGQVEQFIGGGAQSVATGEAQELLESALGEMSPSDREAFMAIAGPVMDRIADEIVEQTVGRMIQSATGRFLLQGAGGAITLPITLFEKLITVPLYLWADKDLMVLQGAYDRILTAQIIAIRMTRDKHPLGVDRLMSTFFDLLSGQRNRAIVICLEARNPAPESREAFKQAFLEELFDGNPPDSWAANDHFDLQYLQEASQQRPYIHFPMYGVRWVGRFDCYCGRYVDKKKSVFTRPPEGTGKTTGHIASIPVENTSSIPIPLESQSFYIPSYGKYQSYVGRIGEGVTIPPGTQLYVPVTGYCTDIHLPPVPDGGSMPPLEDWIPVMSPGETVTEAPPLGIQEQINLPGVKQPSFPIDPAPVRLIPGPGISEFTLDLIDDIVSSDEFLPGDLPSGSPRLTWPGTDIEIPGRFDPQNAGPRFASVVVPAMNRIDDVIPDVQADEDYRTPFSADSLREAEAIGQQTMWIYTAGGTYGKEDFSDKLYSQYVAVTGKKKEDLEEEDQEKLDQGIDEFFNSFMATGVEAKIFKEGGGEAVMISDDRCECDTLTFTLSRKTKGLYVSLGSYESTTFSANGSDKTAENDTIPEDEFSEIELKVHKVKLNCHCNSGPCPHFPESNTDEDDRDEFTFSAGSSSSMAATISDESSDGKEFTFIVKTAKDYKNAYVYFRIKAYCQSADCKRKMCVRKFRRNFVRKPAEE